MKNFAKLAAIAGLWWIAGRGDHPTPLAPLTQSAPAASLRPKPTYEANIAPILERHCLVCHGPESTRGGLDLVALEGRPDLDVWARVAEALRSATMPPGDRPRPSPIELTMIDDWLDSDVFRCGSAEVELGRVTMRRLNRVEYDHTIRDLFGLDLRLADAFPADDIGDGFDNGGDVLSMPPILMEKYLKAADEALGRASESPEAWARIMNPGPDKIPLGLRKPTFAVRSEPVKRIGRPTPPPAPPVEDLEVLLLRRAREILRGFADRAFRRPATVEELDRLVGLIESARKDGDGLDEAIRHALKAVLISPHFLFHVEEEPEPGPARSASDSRLGEFELASRLSYFLWSGPPDDELYRLAARGELRQGETLSIETRRMLGDPKALALVDGFVAQWLQIRAVRDVTPDQRRFPDFDEALRRAMVEETARFAAAILLEDGRVWDFLDGDSTFVNERLARHYGIAGVVGERFRKVSLAGTGRAGVLTQASVLAVTSNPTRTSPVKRGKWVLDNLLGAPPLPPPAGVEALRIEEDHAHPSTLRQQTERHRTDPKCASCHSRMDPIGFALEHFDAIGSWRSLDEGEPIDDSAILPGGEPFNGAPGLRVVLMAHRAAFARCLAGKLLTYAIGRGLGPADRCAVDEVVRAIERGDGRSSALIVAIVASPPFRRRTPSKELR